MRVTPRDGALLDDASIGETLMKSKHRYDLSGKTVLITGAARGIGAHAARRLHSMGANVSLVGIEPESLAGLTEQLGRRAAYFHADVTSTTELRDAAEGTASTFGGIDVVIANAGIAPPTTTIIDIEPIAFERTLEVNLLGVWRTVGATLPYVIERRGHIALIASIYAFLNGTLNASYAMSKAGVEQFGRALSVELAGTGATAGTVYFGFVDTDMADHAFAQPAAAALRTALPAFLTRPMTLATAVDALTDGIQFRRSRVTAPRWVGPALLARGPSMLLDEYMRRSAKVQRAVEVATKGVACRG
ncbi:short-chain dehydrogenase/reductase [Mycobacteroides abscessus]|uniref:short-chain dehydrogenase/reductase n=1 Tax=Mycobacteroides abscessus TaxID=36809 RepID=UPI0009D59A1F|nr:short-chain dehydrogenase/reductase [Mycobacteroides abscessus]MDO2968221.1 short-chain dehydrogenase/reductase [Mycobacteroides abscessus subsp. bolletii]MDO3080445.1 short-chain dehydrogenase/reductase [Mycobacteroides abscessus subsp. bolletii]RIT96789.1 SDR family NAD(P)-dependent oxidoreductase [Mycobacteroides abscessus]SKK53490.1 short-chain alcohol dehydrogenase [Mycobacteroides abscessus subsp. bolletii]